MYLTQFDTETTANTNLNTATLVCTTTNNTRVRKLYVNVYADQVKGNGDYVAYITVQRAGAGSFYESVKTTKAAAEGVTSVAFESIAVVLNATDVMKVYLLGLATDNDGTADVIVDVNEEWLSTDANGRVDLGAWVGVAPAALTASGYVQSILLRWLTDNAAGTPVALSANGLLQVMLLRWLTDNVAGTPPALTGTGHFLQVALERWLTDDAAGTPLALTGTNLVQADAIRLNGAAPNNLAAGAQMDLVNAPNALAVTAIQTGLATAAKLLEYARALARSDAGATSADILGTYNNLTDSLEALQGQITLLAPGAAIVLNAEITEIHTT